MTLLKETVETQELLEIIKEQMEFQAAEKGNRITIDAPEGQLVHVDMDRIIQVLTNIVKNSIQFTEDGEIRLSSFSEPGSTVIEVEDTGAGIDIEEIDLIWRRFFKSDVSRGSGQFGLGLSIVKQLIELHGGDIRAESEKGKGTKFIIRLPDEK